MKFLDLEAQRERLQPSLGEAIDRVLAHSKYILGPEVADLESRLAEYCGTKFCISVANGTDALQVAQMAINIGVGDEVIMPGFTYIATAETTKLLGAKPVYVDVDDKSFCVRADRIEEAITERTKAIIPVSMFGRCADMDTIYEIGSKFQIPVIEDMAQSFGAEYNGRKSGALSDLACTSFFPSKPLGCYGDGGAIFCDAEDFSTIARQIARHGQDRRYHHVRVGMNSRLDTIQAAILIEKLKILDREIDERQAVAQKYAERLSDIDEIQLPNVDVENRSAWAQFTVQVEGRDSVLATLESKGIPYAIHYPMPLYQQPAVEDDTYHLEGCERVAARVVSLPMHPYLKDEEIDRVSDAFKFALKK